jgi:hypothetical protein
VQSKLSFLVASASLAVAGCVSQTQMLDNEQTMAVQAAVEPRTVNMN